MNLSKEYKYVSVILVVLCLFVQPATKAEEPQGRQGQSLEEESSTLEESDRPELIKKEQMDTTKDELDIQDPKQEPELIKIDSDSEQTDQLDIQLDDLSDLVQADDKSEVMDESIFMQELDVGYVVSSARHRQEIGMSPSAITVISRKDIEASGADTMPDLLRLVPGMDVVMLTPMLPTITSRSIWTYENNTYLVLVDGREVTNDVFGQPFYSVQPFILDDIERIEILRGPGSALYGANAFSGVVSITTRKIPSKPSVRATAFIGEVDKKGFQLQASAGLGRFRLALSGGLEEMGRFSDPDLVGKETWRVRAFGNYQLSDEEIVRFEFSAAHATGPATTFGPMDIVIDERIFRLSYDSPSLEAQLYWTNAPMNNGLSGDISYFGFPIAKFRPSDVMANIVDTQIQWTLPEFYQPLMIIVGGFGRLNTLNTDEMIDAATYADPTSSRYHELGYDGMELRTGAFVHGEWAPTNWVTVTCGVRFDYSTETPSFISPRLASVFRLTPNQFLRLGGGRAFRRPSFLETQSHSPVDYPDNTILTSSQQEAFLEMMTRVIGNADLGNEETFMLEAGYYGQFVDKTLNLSLDLYYSWTRNMIQLNPQIVNTIVIDDIIAGSSFMYDHVGDDLDIFGWELAIEWKLTESISFLANWSHKEVTAIRGEDSWTSDETPKNLFALGGRFRTGWGLIGSLYAFSRSEFWDRYIDSPDGIMAPYEEMHFSNSVLWLAKIGYRHSFLDTVQFELGAKLFLPMKWNDEKDELEFRYYERGGGQTDDDPPVLYGGDRLRRLVTLYLQGSF